MSGCCNQDCSVDKLRGRQRGTLQIVLGINTVMFIVIVFAAFTAKSTALMADSLITLAMHWLMPLAFTQFREALLSKLKLPYSKEASFYLQLSLLLHKLFTNYLCRVFLSLRLWVPSVFFLWLLIPFVFFFYGDIAMKMWIWVRYGNAHENDIASNLSVFVAAGAVWFTGSGWPDIVVALGLVWLLMSSAIRVISSAMGELRKST